MFFKSNLAEKSIMISVPILFVVGSLMHFLYDFTGKNAVVGLFCPISESIWEHEKLMVFPLIAFWIFYYLFNTRKQQININKWFTGAVISVLSSIIIMPMIFYFYRGAFGVGYLVVDIAILFITLLIAQLLGLHFYKYSRGINFIISITILAAVVIIFMYFTVCPPDFPMFIDSSVK